MEPDRATPGAAWRRRQAGTKPLRDAIVTLDLALHRAMPSCDRACYRSHRFHAPLVPLRLVEVDAPPPSHWERWAPVDGPVLLAVGLAGDDAHEHILPQATRLEAVVRQSSHTAYFQGQTEFLYRVVGTPGVWVIGIGDAVRGPVEMLVAGWMIAPVHPPTADLALGARLLDEVAGELEAALVAERRTPPGDPGRDARLPEGRSMVLERVLRSLGDAGSPPLKEILDRLSPQGGSAHRPPVDSLAGLHAYGSPGPKALLAALIGHDEPDDAPRDPAAAPEARST